MNTKLADAGSRLSLGTWPHLQKFDVPFPPGVWVTSEGDCTWIADADLLFFSGLLITWRWPWQCFCWGTDFALVLTRYYCCGYLAQEWEIWFFLSTTICCVIMMLFSDVIFWWRYVLLSIDGVMFCYRLDWNYCRFQTCIMDPGITGILIYRSPYCVPLMTCSCYLVICFV